MSTDVTNPTAVNPEAVSTNRVIVAVDGSPASLEALRVGQHLARLFQARLVGVNAWQAFRHGVLPPTSTHPAQFAEQMVAESLRAAFLGTAVPETEILAVEGDPADALIALSRDASLLVVGSRGHAGLSAVVLGSVSTACGAHAACPVLIVHAPVSAARVIEAQPDIHQRAVPVR